MAKRPRKSRRKTADQIDELLSPAAPAAGPAAPPARRHFSPDEHIAWAESTCYRNAKQGWIPLVYSGWQRRAIRALFAVNAGGTLRYRTIIPCFPRRTGKSELTGLYDLHRCLEYEDQLVVIQANSEDQGEETVLRTIVDTIRNSPKLAEEERAGRIEVLAGTVLFHRTGSTIRVQPAKEASAYGRRIDVYHNTELCKAASDAIYQVGASSTGDAWCGVAIVDSNMGGVDNAVYRYVTLAEDAEVEAAFAAAEGRQVNPAIGDPSVVAVWVRFADLADCLRRGCGLPIADCPLPIERQEPEAPGGTEGEASASSNRQSAIGNRQSPEPIHPWLDPVWIRGRYAQMTRGEFLRNHCNQPSGAGQALWSDEQIDPLFLATLPVPQIPVASHLARVGEIVRARGAWSIGVGLDRAGAFSKNPDRTVLAVVGRVIAEGYAGPVAVYDERGNAIDAEICDGSLYVLLAAWEYMRELRDPLQQRLIEIDRAWSIGSAALEAYQASDLGEWCGRQRFAKRVSVEHMTAQAKHQLVTFLHGLVITRRFVASASYTVLHAEMTNYREDAGGAIPSYGGPRRTIELPVASPVSGAALGRETTWIKDDYFEAVLWAVYAARGAPAKARARIVAKPAGL